MNVQGVPPLEELKLIYYLTMIRYHAHHNNYLEICRAFKAMYETEGVANDPEKWRPVGALAANSVWYSWPWWFEAFGYMYKKYFQGAFQSDMDMEPQPLQ